jgi:hypothetical protein
MFYTFLCKPISEQDTGCFFKAGNETPIQKDRILGKGQGSLFGIANQ